MRADILLGVVTVLMAVLGGIVSVHAPTKLWYKVAYASGFVLLGVISVVLTIMVSNENAAANKDLNNAVVNLGTSTNEIARVTSLNTQLQQKVLGQSQTISRLAQESVNSVTGGDSFCFITLAGDKKKLVLWNPGDYPLTGVEIQLVDYARHHDDKRQLQTIPPHTSGPYPYELTATGDRQDFLVTFSAVNGAWWETLQLRKVNEIWQQALRVEKLPKRVKLEGTTKPRTLREYIEPLYPGAVDKKVEWCEFVVSKPRAEPNPCIPGSGQK